MGTMIQRYKLGEADFRDLLRYLSGLGRRN